MDKKQEDTAPILIFSEKRMGFINDELLGRILQQILNTVFEITSYVQKLDHLSNKEKVEKYCNLSLDYIIEQPQLYGILLTDYDQGADNFIQFNPYIAEFENGISDRMREFFLNVYGAEINPFVGDIVFIFNSLFGEYSMQMFDADSAMFKKASQLIANVLDMVVQQFREKHIEAFLSDKLIGMEAEQDPSTDEKEKQVTELIKTLERKVDSGDKEQKLSPDWEEGLKYLKYELTGPKPRFVIVKSLLRYLGQSEELAEPCTRIERLLFSS
ncbi:hypothetical protein EHV15_22055 [Paenibacillus oralis]|uniref:Uncharacterized protein n=1 Tax=Paenibacillus oralis TaxID=2490856 RepID=A0A3P3UA18_9BACL|nr:hypothetical protein [Paenibacillus oralis]RRJ65293.1 hypothetical protein EHV15_22055 [Paenibacillus oralis]